MLDLKRTYGIYYVLVLFLLFVSCSNPFENKSDVDENFYSENYPMASVLTGTYTEEQLCEGEENTNTGTVIITLDIKVQDAEITAVYDECSVTLESVLKFDEYAWWMSDKLVSEAASCVLDFSGYAENVYPVVLRAMKDDVSYSSMYFISYDGEKFINENSPRTIVPFVLPSYLKDITVRITSLSNGSTNLFSFKNYTEFTRKQYVLETGEYIFQFSSVVGDCCLSGDYYANIITGLNRIQIVPVVEQMPSEQSGKLELDFEFPVETAIPEISVFLYKQEERLSLIKEIYVDKSEIEKKDSNSGLFSLYAEEMPAGFYWIRVNIFFKNEMKASYFAEYIHIKAGLTSKKKVLINQFYELYTIKYEFNEGIFTGKRIQSLVSSFDEVMLPCEQDMKKFGARFSGWYYDKEFKKPCPQILKAGSVRSDLKLYACWKSEPDLLEGGVGLLEKENLSVNSSGKNISIAISSPIKADLFVINMYNAVNECVKVEIKSISFLDSVINIDAELTKAKNDLYIIEISAFNNMELVFNENQLIKL